jgi:hypothetical protein
MSSAAEDAKKRIRLGIKVTVIILVVGGLLFAVDKGFDIGIYSAIGSGIGSISTGGGGGGGVSGGAGGGGDGGAGGGGGMGIILLAVAAILLLFLGRKGLGGIGRWRAKHRDPGEAPDIYGDDADDADDEEVEEDDEGDDGLVPEDEVPGGGPLVPDEVPPDAAAIVDDESGRHYNYTRRIMSHRRRVDIHDYIEDFFVHHHENDKIPLFELISGGCDRGDNTLFLSHYSVLRQKLTRDMMSSFLIKHGFNAIMDTWQMGRSKKVKITNYNYAKELPIVLAIINYYRHEEKKLPEYIERKMPLAHLFGENVWVSGKNKRQFSKLVMSERKPNFLPSDDTLKQFFPALEKYNELLDDKEIQDDYLHSREFRDLDNFPDDLKLSATSFNTDEVQRFYMALTSYLWSVFSRRLPGATMDTFLKVISGFQTSSGVQTSYGLQHRLYTLIKEREIKFALENAKYESIQGQTIAASQRVPELINICKQELATLNEICETIERDDFERIKGLVKKNTSYEDRNGDKVTVFTDDAELDTIVPQLKAFLLLTFVPWKHLMADQKLHAIVWAKLVENLKNLSNME